MNNYFYYSTTELVMHRPISTCNFKRKNTLLQWIWPWQLDLAFYLYLLAHFIFAKPNPIMLDLTKKDINLITSDYECYCCTNSSHELIESLSVGSVTGCWWEKGFQDRYIMFPVHITCFLHVIFIELYVIMHMLTFPEKMTQIALKASTQNVKCQGQET